MNVCQCGKPAIRDGKCEEHKIERRTFGDRRAYGSSDSLPTCGNGLCRVEYGQTRHNTMCPDYGPGWA